ncbi:hypothetical protein MYU51_015311 [Penicillium brevicompactum]|uniref:uncharacterized protein n=1 Tax=Penicillium brevicompactum TaxID=5074 RepID=UPI0025405FAF|nr:uncharacterized protein N7506_006507 [Penicillium brevicompactum]KAJ5332724.1 hypothetical protein N7506_006507 [Penicillium brevicompactum]
MQASLNASANVSTSQTPHQLMFGVDLRMPWNLLRQAFVGSPQAARQDADECAKYAPMLAYAGCPFTRNKLVSLHSESGIRSAGPSDDEIAAELHSTFDPRFPTTTAERTSICVFEAADAVVANNISSAGQPITAWKLDEDSLIGAEELVLEHLRSVLHQHQK